jgi:hypothetical protein
MKTASMSRLPTTETAPNADGPSATAANATGSEQLGTAWPTETEIYILPDGRVVIADLPAELAAAAAALGAVEACEIEPHDEPHSPL